MDFALSEECLIYGMTRRAEECLINKFKCIYPERYMRNEKGGAKNEEEID